MIRRITGIYLARTILARRLLPFGSALSNINSSMPSKARRNKSTNNKANNKRKIENHAAIVGPDYMQCLTGRLFQKDVTLVLCGESHQDAIDVTRRKGIFVPKEGWIPVAAGTEDSSTISAMNILQQSQESQDDNIVLRIVARTKKRLPLGKSKDWAKDIVEEYDSESFGQILLVWIKDLPEGRVLKGQAFVLEATLSEDELDEEEQKEGWFYFDAGKKSGGCPSLPADLEDWIRMMSCMQQSSNNTSIIQKAADHYEHFHWGDLDLEAHELNMRRLTDEEISEDEIDSIIRKRKIERRKENIWTWDDWFSHIRSQCNNSEDTDIHLVFESMVPPWELELHRPSSDVSPEVLNLPPAADCIRCVMEDGEESVEAEFDPSSDGAGSYIDFVYRRLMEEMLAEQDQSETSNVSSTWFHCVDTRSLGCQTECQSGPTKAKWNALLLKDEAPVLLDDHNDRTSFLPLEADATGRFIKFVPESRMNPERLVYNEMKSKGAIVEDEDESESEEGDFTFPSFEGFLGQNADFLYYDSHVNVSYSPFLAKCVGSLEKWESFFTELFFGGNIAEALAYIDLQNEKEHLYVRSPIQKTWDPDAATYAYEARDDGEHYITQPFFPFIFYLSSSSGEKSRTWSSELFASLCNQSSTSLQQLSDTDLQASPKLMAMSAREWILGRIKQHAVDPKSADDPLCGGEWFEAYLKTMHREIYDDIDTLDCSALLRKNNMKSESYTGRKYNIGKIQIPSCEDAYKTITQHFRNSDNSSHELISPQIEILAKIIIDIWVSSLVDFASVLKIGDVISRSKKDKVVVVCYMGSAHTRAVADFYISRMDFKKRGFAGKTDWDDDTEPHSVHLPSYLWNIAELFNRKS